MSTGPGWGVNADDLADQLDNASYASQEAAESEDSDAGEANGDFEVSDQGGFFGDSTGDWSWSE